MTSLKARKRKFSDELALDPLDYSPDLMNYILSQHQHRAQLIDDAELGELNLRRIHLNSLVNFYTQKRALKLAQLAAEASAASLTAKKAKRSRQKSSASVNNDRDSTPASTDPKILPHRSTHVRLDPMNKELRRALADLALPPNPWSVISAHSMPVVFRHRQQMATNKVHMANIIASACSTVVQSYTAALSSPQNLRVSHRAKKGSKEMLMFWRKHEKEERESRKRAEKEVLDRMKQEEEDREKRRQAKKLQFLLTQTELYSHFVGNKLAKEALPADTALAHDLLDVSADQMDFDALDESDLNELAKRKAKAALEDQHAKTKAFDQSTSFTHGDVVFDQNVPQPAMLNCKLKTYQLKGLNWLANLYEQGINGILADDMGLGKTVQSISLLAHIAETHNIWGPFLVVSPASTLHNWQQEFVKFTPHLKAVPYWGSAKDRKTLRKFWSGNRLYSQDSPFHVVITSYQLVVTDQQYFQRMKWQYMVLDEAHAIKSANSARWKTLLHFNCRNRLLLTGTPIQNSMTELWALLHFIMPTIFDSHQEFFEWFSKDIETHAQDKEKGKLNERQLKRLHTILKPFMLRRVKSDVEHELGRKIEKTVYCNLTPRQKKMYDALDKPGIADLLDNMEADETLMNMVMQFRKVCNHPQIFEQAEVSSPYIFGYDASGKMDHFVPYRMRNPICFRIPVLLWKFISVCPRKVPTIWNVEGLESESFGFLRFLGYSSGQVVKMTKSPIIVRALTEQFLRESLVPIAPYISQCQNRRLFLYAGDPKWSSLPHLTALANVNSSMLYRFIRITPAYFPSAQAAPVDLYCASASFINRQRHQNLDPLTRAALCGTANSLPADLSFLKELISKRSIKLSNPRTGMSHIRVPNARQLLFESGKLEELDKLLVTLKAEGHRVLIYFQMTKMIDLMEEFLTFRQYSYLRLDGSCKISDRRDLVSDWQTRPDLFIFLLSTRAGGLGINLTAADTVIFYDSDWNPTVDQQAMDRAHRLGQTKQVTVYRLVTKGTIEERILERALQKDEIQKVVISDGAFTQNSSAGLKEASPAKIV